MEFQFYQYFELLGLVMAFFCLKGLRQYSIALFLVLLVIDNTIEIIGENYRYFGLRNSYLIYNFYFVTGTPVSLLLFRPMLAPKGLARNVFDGIILLAMTFIALNLVFLQGVKQFNSYSTLVAMVLNVAFSCLILFRIATKDSETSLFIQPYYWINAGILVFSIITLVVLGLQQYIIAHRLFLHGSSLYHFLLPLANILLYIGYSIGFYLCRQQANR